MKQTGMLVVSLRNVNSDVWSRLGCPWQKPNVLKPSRSRLGLQMKKQRKINYIFTVFGFF